MIANYNCSSLSEHGMSSHVVDDGEENLVLSVVLNNVLLTIILDHICLLVAL